MRLRIGLAPWMALAIAALVGVAWRALAQGPPAGAPQSRSAHYDGSDWHLKGEGVVCCPCAVPCPCRTNGAPSYGHCEATLYLRIRQGHYGKVRLNGLQVVDTSGACGMSYDKLAALYFDRTTPPEMQAAFLQLLANFSNEQTEEFPYVRTVPMTAEVTGGSPETGGRLFRVSIPQILEMVADRNWGKANPPLPFLAAQDRFANALQYAQNIRYRMHDDDAGLDFDYSRRQANYRAIDLDAEDYRARRMIVQYLDGSGWFNAPELEIIHQQRLTLPDPEAIRRKVSQLRASHGGAN